MTAKYQLVLQFALAPRDVAQFDRVSRIEDELSKPSMLYQLDGHDCTSGRMELQLLTDDPARAFEIVHGLLPACCAYRAAYRELAGGTELSTISR